MVFAVLRSRRAVEVEQDADAARLGPVEHLVDRREGNLGEGKHREGVFTLE